MQAAKDFRKNAVHALTECDDKLDRASLDKIDKLAATVAVLLKRIETMETIQDAVIQRSQDARRETKELSDLCDAKRVPVQQAITAIVNDIKQLQQRRKEAYDQRVRERQQFESKATTLKDSNELLDLSKAQCDIMRYNEI